MASVICKDNSIFYILFGRQHSSVYSRSKFNLRSSVEKNGRGTFIDTRMLDLEYYDGWEANEHHITTKSHYNILAPFFSYILKTFNFNPRDFVIVPYFTKDFKQDVTYLKPRKRGHYTMSINSVEIGKHLSFDEIQNITQHADAEAFKACTDELPIYSEYHRLYRGAHACSRVINEDIKEDTSIFISGDSMMIPLIPIFCYYYKEVVFMDNRDGNSHKEYFEDKTFDEVLLCFFEDSSENKVLGINLL